MTIKTICAWCREHLAGPTDALSTSHGICAKCKEKFCTEVRKASSSPHDSPRIKKESR